MLVRVLCLAVSIPLASVTWSAAQNSAIEWLTDLETAQRQAVAENKIVLVHFWGTYCRPCLNLDHFVFTHAMIGSAVAADYIPVKIDVEKFPQLAKKFEIRTIPHDVMLSPDGQLITKRASPNNSDGYLHMLTSVAETYRRTHPGTFKVASELGSRFPNASGERAYMPAGQGSISREPLTLLNYVDRQGDEDLGSTPAAVASQGDAVGNLVSHANLSADSIATSPPDSPAWSSGQLLRPKVEVPTGSASPSSPVGPAGMSGRTEFAAAMQARVVGNLPAPLGLEGLCPVTLYQTGTPTAGNSRWGCVHRGRLYFFASREAFERFRLTPDVFSPVLAGNDPVEYSRTGDLQSGEMKYHVFHPLESRNVLLLFRSEENRAAFLYDPNRYLNEVQLATQFADAPVILR